MEVGFAGLRNGLGLELELELELELAPTRATLMLGLPLGSALSLRFALLSPPAPSGPPMKVTGLGGVEYVCGGSLLFSILLGVVSSI